MKSPYLRIVLFVYASALSATWPRYRIPDSVHCYAVAYTGKGWRGIYLPYDPVSMHRRFQEHAATPYYLAVVVSSPDHSLVAPGYTRLLADLKGNAVQRWPGFWPVPHP